MLLHCLIQELEKLAAEKSRIETESEKQAAKFKYMDEDRSRLQKSASTQQSAMLKQKQVVDDLKTKLTAAENQATTFKRQNEQLQRDVKSQQSNVGASEVFRYELLNDECALASMWVPILYKVIHVDLKIQESGGKVSRQGAILRTSAAASDFTKATLINAPI